MSHYSANHVLLQFILLLSFFVAAHSAGKNFQVMVVNLSQRKFAFVAVDENGDVKKRETGFTGRRALAWSITRTTRSTSHTCHLTYEDEGVKRTVTLNLFYEQEEDKWLAQETDSDGTVYWDLKDEGVYYTDPKTIESIFYRTWQVLERKTKRKLRFSVTNNMNREFVLVVKDVKGNIQKTRTNFARLDVVDWHVIGTTRETYYTCELTYDGDTDRKTVTFEVFKEEDEHLWLEQDTDEMGHVPWFIRDDGVYGKPSRCGNPNYISITWANLESEAIRNSQNG